MWTAGDGEEWLRILTPATECPRIAREFLEQERRAQGERMFRQEYLCEFTDADDSLFGSELIRSVLVKDDGLAPGREEWWRNERVRASGDRSEARILRRSGPGAEERLHGAGAD